GLSPGLSAPFMIDTACLLGDNPFKPKLASLLKELFSPSNHMIAEPDQFVLLADKRMQQRLSLQQWRRSEIPAIQIQPIEHDKIDVRVAFANGALQSLKAGATVWYELDYLAIENRRLASETRRGPGDLGKAIGPVVPAPGNQRNLIRCNLAQKAVAVE